MPTDRGLALFGVLERADPALVDPGVTAELECLLDDVVTGKQEKMAAIDAVCDAARRIIGRLGDGAVAGATAELGKVLGDGSGGERPPTAAMKRFAASLAPEQGHQAARGLCEIGSDLPGISGSARAGAGRPGHGGGTRGSGGVQTAEFGADVVCRGDRAG